MEINYDLIIKYLVTKKDKFISKKHILINSENFPDKFKEFIQNKFYRYGITHYDDKNYNISFYSCLLTLLDKNFITLDNKEEIENIISFKNKIKNEINDINDSNKLQKISDLLEINFIIFDFKNETIIIIYNGEYCNPFKPTFLIAKYDEFYEPIIFESENKRVFSYNDVYIKKIYQANYLFENELNNKKYKLNDNINEIIKEFIIVEQNQNALSEPFIKDIYEEYNATKLNKLTKKELQNILEKKNINVNINKMLKKDIISLILK
jgi:hypothetical protein